MSENERELAMLRDFARTKTYEFPGFKFQWEQQHPAEAASQPTIEPVVAAVPEPIVEEPAKTTRKKKTVEPAPEE